MYLLEFLLVFVGFIVAFLFGVSLFDQYNTYGNVNLSLFIFEVSLILILCISILGVPKIRKTSSYWRFDDYEDAEKFLISEYPNLEYTQEDKEKLLKLLFFGWDIDHSSTSENIILTRKSSSKDEKIIFHKK